LQPGYQSLVVTLDGAPVAASGTVTMNGAHILAVSATVIVPPATTTRLDVWGGPNYDIFLGSFTCYFCTEYSSNSINNRFGSYGSEFSSTSIRNEFFPIRQPVQHLQCVQSVCDFASRPLRPERHVPR